MALSRWPALFDIQQLHFFFSCAAFFSPKVLWFCCSVQFLGKLGPQVSSCGVWILMYLVVGGILKCRVARVIFRCRLAGVF